MNRVVLMGNHRGIDMSAPNSASRLFTPDGTLLEIVAEIGIGVQHLWVRRPDGEETMVLARWTRELTPIEKLAECAECAE